MTGGSINQQFSLDGKVAIVTGGSKGIGKGIAKKLALAGARVMIVARSMEAANKTVDEIVSRDGIAAAIQADVSVIEDAFKVVEDTVKEFGRLDILVNNAALYTGMPFLDVTEELYDRTLAINLKGTFFFSQAAAQEMIKEEHGGKIINIASKDALHPSGLLTHYGASKGGVVSLTKAMAKELAVHGILVNAIAPGGVATPGSSSAFQPMIEKYGKTPEEVEKVIDAALDRPLLKRLGTPGEIGDVAVFLASPASDYIVGVVINADGGIILG